MVFGVDAVVRHAPRERGEAEREGSLGDKRVEEREMCKCWIPLRHFLTRLKRSSSAHPAREMRGAAPHVHLPSEVVPTSMASSPSTLLRSVIGDEGALGPAARI